ncbi:hypothetical protein PPL_06286 [Heterostelium album PN500]|uniref:Ankyrin repeat protein n=1 Tax=Heterostelium pallidum (strain ATCC 26659 / Pp 5 / PN500) TaxID=670386 RepID=D3BCR0_HETP5|nr:hypothetical protein PPL_06286 [Heterostelium album PN500]EFA80702.1 hypothetical protein PPL_06286 [Heterostelium album PN500]|eukprot:XP_020432822.1 hypothetical protein PPL_06286 [Heterostelium album PN500]
MSTNTSNNIIDYKHILLLRLLNNKYIRIQIFENVVDIHRIMCVESFKWDMLKPKIILKYNLIDRFESEYKQFLQNHKDKSKKDRLKFYIYEWSTLVKLGHFELAKSIYTNIKDYYSKIYTLVSYYDINQMYNKTVENACLEGDMAILRFLHNDCVPKTKWSQKCLSLAAVKSDVEVLLFLLKGGQASNLFDNIFNTAASHGNLSFLKWYYDNRIVERMSTDLHLRLASIGGHLETVKFLLDRDKESVVSDLTMVCSINNGHPDVFKLMYQRRGCECNHYSLRQIVDSQNVDLIEFLYQHRSEKLGDPFQHYRSDRFFKAIEMNNSKMLEIFIRETVNFCFSELLIKAAASLSTLRMLKFIYDLWIKNNKKITSTKKNIVTKIILKLELLKEQYNNDNNNNHHEESNFSFDEIINSLKSLNNKDMTSTN